MRLLGYSGVPKGQLIKFRHRKITQKKEYDIADTIYLQYNGLLTLYIHMIFCVT